MIDPKLVWTGYGGYKGWAHWGTQTAAKLEVPGDEWLTKAVRIAARAEGNRCDGCQCYDSGIMTIGPLQATAAFGYLQHFVGKLMRYDFQRFDYHVGEVMFERSRSTVWGATEGLFTRGGFAFYSIDKPADDQSPTDTRPELQRILLGGSDGKSWTRQQTERAAHWVRSFVSLLRDPTFEAAIAEECGWMLRRFLWSKAVPYLDQIESEPGLLRATYLAFAINHPAGALRLLKGSVEAMTDSKFAKHLPPTPENVAGFMLQSARQREYRTPNTFPLRAKQIAKGLSVEFGYWEPS
jgi:hypothetical protein